MSPTTQRTPKRGRRSDVVTTGTAVKRGLIALVVLTVVLAIALRAPDGVPGVPVKTVFASLPDIGNLQRHSDVRIAGKRVGQIMKTEAEGGSVRLEIHLAPDANAIPADSTVVVRSAGLLGQRYLEIKPGSSPREVTDGGTLEPASLAITSGVPEVLQTFDAETRGGLGKTVRGLGTGLLGRSGDLNAAIAASPQAAHDFRVIAGAITADEPAARRLVPALSSAAGALATASDATVQALPPATQALTPFVDLRDEVRATLSKAPGTLTTASAAFSESVPLLAATRRLSIAANRVLPRTPRALRATTTLLRGADTPLRRARPLLRSARQAVPDVLRVTRALDPVLKPLREPLDQLLEPVRRVGRHSCDLGNFAQVWNSFLGFGVPGGGKIGPLGEIRAEALVRMPFAEAGEAVRLPDGLIARDTYPAPCAWLGDTYNPLDPTK